MVWWQILVIVVAVVLGIPVGVFLGRTISKQNKDVANNSIQVHSPPQSEQTEKTQKQPEQLPKEKEPSAREEVKQEVKTAEEEAVTGVYQGYVLLSILPPASTEQINKLQEYLTQISDYRLLLIGGSADGGSYIALSLAKPLNLGDQLRGIPIVDKVFKQGKKIGIKLK